MRRGLFLEIGDAKSRTCTLPHTKKKGKKRRVLIHRGEEGDEEGKRVSAFSVVCVSMNSSDSCRLISICSRCVTDRRVQQPRFAFYPGRFGRRRFDLAARHNGLGRGGTRAWEGEKEKRTGEEKI